MKTFEVLFTPVDFAALLGRDLSDTVCVVFDIFRATSSMTTALANGADAIVPVEEIPEALAARQREPGALLAGERDGLRIPAALANGTDFDLGNSPREFTREKVGGKTIVMTTTNGTRALRACAHARTVLIGTFLNLQATARFIERQRPEHLLLVCSGTFEQASYEDTLGAGALCDQLRNSAPDPVSDSPQMARWLYQQAQANLLEAAAKSRNGRRLHARPELRDDIAFCMQRDVHDFVAVLGTDGKVRKL